MGKNLADAKAKNDKSAIKNCSAQLKRLGKLRDELIKKHEFATLNLQSSVAQKKRAKWELDAAKKFEGIHATASTTQTKSSATEQSANKLQNQIDELATRIGRLTVCIENIEKRLSLKDSAEVSSHDVDSLGKHRVELEALQKERVELLRVRSLIQQTG
jgi:hypothetical protein